MVDITNMKKIKVLRKIIFSPQVDMEPADYEDHPEIGHNQSDFDALARSASKKDLKNGGIKGFAHKYALMSLTKRASKDFSKSNGKVIVKTGADKKSCWISTPSAAKIISLHTMEELAKAGAFSGTKKSLSEEELLKAVKILAKQMQESGIKQSLPTKIRATTEDKSIANSLPEQPENTAKIMKPTTAESYLTFFVGGGLRQKFGNVLTSDGQAIMLDDKMLLTKLSGGYETNISNIFTRLFGLKPTKKNLEDFSSFTGLIDLIKENATHLKQFHGSKSNKAFIEGFFASMVYRFWGAEPYGDKRAGEIERPKKAGNERDNDRTPAEDDLKAKAPAVEYMMKVFKLDSVHGVPVDVIRDNYYDTWSGTGGDDDFIGESEEIPVNRSFSKIFESVENESYLWD